MASTPDPDAPANGPPPGVINQARAAAAGNPEPTPPASSHGSHHHLRLHGHHKEKDNGSRTSGPAAVSSNVPGMQDDYSKPIEDVPPPAYNGKEYGQMSFDQSGVETGARIADDGRVNIKINQKNKKLSNLLAPALRTQLELHRTHTYEQSDPYIPPGFGSLEDAPPPPLNVVIQVVGSRGDVQPFVSLGQVLKQKYGHRVRLATHPTFKTFVEENGLEFFSIGGDPAELMAFMVKNPGLMPGMDSLKNGDIGKRRAGMYEMILGCWRSCIEAGDGTGPMVSDSQLHDGRASFDSGVVMEGDPLSRPFVADAIIANPPSFAHMHIAEKLGIPLHLMFTMPWSPTQSFPHPLANITASNADASMTNFMTYALVDMMTWQGLGDIINRFREKSLGLEPVSIMWAPGMASRLRIPYTYCWSPALIPKPKDWGPEIDISGFFFLSLASNYTPAEDLKAFLDAGPPPVYIGFGSIVVDDPNAMTKLIFDAVKKTGQRALVSKGWGGFGADQIGIPEGVFMLGNVPHDWLFKHVSCVVHHGGAGTTAAGILAGRPTVVVPFFGDQPFWGSMTARAGAGPMPVPYKTLTADKLAAAIQEALKPESLERAAVLSSRMSSEKGAETGAQSFHKQLHVNDLRCALAPSRVAVWRVKRTDIRLSAFAATVLGNEGLLDFNDLKLYRPREYETEEGPWDPITGGASALIGTIGNLTMGIADMPVEVLKGLRIASAETKAHAMQRASDAQISRSRENSPAPSPTHSRHTSTQLGRSSTNQSTTSLNGHRQSMDMKAVSPTAEGTEERPSLSAIASNDSAASIDSHKSSLSRAMSEAETIKPSRSHSRHGSRSGSPFRHHRTFSNEPCPGELVSAVTLETVVGTGKGVGKIVGAGLKSPMEFTMGIARGFHNAPKLYGDQTVRRSEKITGIESGFKAAGKEFGYGFYDGITGMVSQPLDGAKKEGAAGFLKGVGKGFGGLILKPGAAIWGIPGYTFKGIYQELQKVFGTSVQNYIIAARTAQGYEDWKSSTAEERRAVITGWKSSQLEIRRRGRVYGKDRENEPQGFMATRKQSWDQRKQTAEDKKRVKKEAKAKGKEGKVKSKCKHCPFHHEEGYHHKREGSVNSLQHSMTFPGASPPMDEQHDFEEAIQRSVTATSKGDPVEDKLIERALRASVLELQNAQTQGAHDEAYERALKASVKEARTARAEAGDAKSPVANAVEHDEHLELALKQSLEQHHHHHAADATHEHDWSSDSGFGTEDDEAYRNAIEESKRLHTNKSSTAPTEADAGDDDDDELNKALTESEKSHSAELSRQQTEEDLVLEYAKKQSLMEDEHKKRMAEMEAEHQKMMADMARGRGPAPVEKATENGA